MQVDLGLEAAGAAGGDDGVVVAGRHLVRPQLERLIAQAVKLDLIAVGEAMALPDGDAHDLAPDRPLAHVVAIRGQRRERDVAIAVAQERGDVAAEDLAGVDLEQRVVLVEPGEQHGDGLKGADEGIDEPQGSHLTSGGGLHAPRGAVGASEHAPAIGQKYTVSCPP
jgi:hypothetical protein